METVSKSLRNTAQIIKLLRKQCPNIAEIVSGTLKTHKVGHHLGGFCLAPIEHKKRSPTWMIRSISDKFPIDFDRFLPISVEILRCAQGFQNKHPPSSQLVTEVSKKTKKSSLFLGPSRLSKPSKSSDLGKLGKPGNPSKQNKTSFGSHILITFLGNPYTLSSRTWHHWGYWEQGRRSKLMGGAMPPGAR